MTGGSGLRRFVTGPATPAGPAEPAGPAAAAGASADAGASVPAGAAAPSGLTTPPTAGLGPAPGAAPGGQAEEKCELCAEVIPAEHGHVADIEHATLLCACRACYLLFTHGQAVRGRYRAVPDRYLSDPARPLTGAEWEELEIPVGLAFFLRGSAADEVHGFYPSPAGATECRLDLAAWNRLAADHPLFGELAPDVEAVLICRTEGTVEHYLVPIDACYELAGRMRLLWRGFDGGAEARQSISSFIGQVRARARPLPETARPETALPGTVRPETALPETGLAETARPERSLSGGR